jgi:hypothetical protein
MTVYFGIPVDIYEACRIFGLDIERASFHIMKKYNFDDQDKVVHYLPNYLRKVLKKNYDTKIQIHRTYKFQYVIGYEVKEINIIGGRYHLYNVDEFMMLLLQLKKQFTEEMKIMLADLSEVLIDHIEDEPEVVKEPMPFLVSNDGFT